MCLNLWYGMGGGGCSIWIAFIVCVLLLLVIDSWAGVHGEGGLPAWLVLLLGGRREGSSNTHSLPAYLPMTIKVSFFYWDLFPSSGMGRDRLVLCTYLSVCVCPGYTLHMCLVWEGPSKQPGSGRACCRFSAPVCMYVPLLTLWPLISWAHGSDSLLRGGWARWAPVTLCRYRHV
jgi:hypothetical protein